jgi:leader peptidase (prepilin peptidase)/N-methyltransferase
MCYVGVLLILGICCVTDFLYQKIWMPVVLFSMPGIVICLSLTGEWNWSNLAAGLLVCLFFEGMSVLTRGQLGKGDGAVLGLVSLALGVWDGTLFLMASFFYAFVAALFLVIFLRKKRNTKMPFVPFVLLGYITVLLFR